VAPCKSRIGQRCGNRQRLVTTVTTMLTRRRDTKASPDQIGDESSVSRVALIRPFAAFCGVLAVLIIFWPDWIEALTGFDPDQHDGTVEWLIVIALLSTAPYWRSHARQMAPSAARQLTSLD
jgi:hypothetical protein